MVHYTNMLQDRNSIATIIIIKDLLILIVQTLENVIITESSLS